MSNDERIVVLENTINHINVSLTNILQNIQCFYDSIKTLERIAVLETEIKYIKIKIHAETRI